MGEIYYRSRDAIDIEILAKLMVLEYIDIDLFRTLNKWNKKAEDKIEELKELIDLAEKDENFEEKYNNWNNQRVKRWLLSEPKDIYKEDLSKYFYLSRESLTEGINSIESLTKNEKEILNRILNCAKGKDREAMKELKTIDSESSNKIIKLMIKMFKENKIKVIKIAIIYEEFTSWRSEILEHMKSFTKADLKLSNMVYIQLIYKATPNEMEDVISIWKEKKAITDKAIKYLRGIQNGDI